MERSAPRAGRGIREGMGTIQTSSRLGTQKVTHRRIKSEAVRNLSLREEWAAQDPGKKKKRGGVEWNNSLPTSGKIRENIR